jgi:hypothetical protein
MEKIQSGNELYEHIRKMSKTNSVTQIYIPGKGTFKILLQEEDSLSILSEDESDSGFRQMIKDSRVAYTTGDRITTEQFLATISPTDFAK